MAKPRLTVAQLTQSVDCADHGQAYTARGYGTGYALTEVGLRRLAAHRLVFETYYGYRPEVVMHDCDNPRCINPLHLSPGTYELNNRDRAAKGRSAQNVRAKRKLTDRQAAEIRADYIPGSPKGSPNGVMAIAKRFGVDPNVVYQISSGRTYRDVA